MKEINVLSFGAGVQSSTLALLSHHGLHGVPKMDFAVFADTGAEPKRVYETLERFKKFLNFPLVVEMNGKGLRENILQSLAGGRFTGAPFFTESDNGVGRLRRQCTKEFKLEPITQAVRKRLGVSKGERVKGVVVNVWIGISKDEMQRMTTPLKPWMRNHYPLVTMNWRRSHCEAFLAEYWPHPVAKSSCTFCPYHDNKLWKEIKDTDPEAWADAVEIDRKIRGGVRGTTQKCYLHRSLQPLETINFEALLKTNQKEFGFIEECEGICGL